MDRPAEFLYHVFWQALDWIYPPICAGCGEPGKIWCETCHKSVKKISGTLCDLCGYPKQDLEVCPGCDTYGPQFTSIRSWAVYSGGVKEAIHALKYQNNLSLGTAFSDSLVGMIKDVGWKLDVVIPIPLSKTRMKERGYNQAKILAFPVALALGKPLDEKYVIRTRNTESQVHLHQNERAANLKDAFTTTSHKWMNKNVLIVDDVITTGSTINECARVLIESGVKQVFGLSLARAVIGDMAA